MAMDNRKNKRLTFSFDDGINYDRRLVALFNKYGLKGTFNINTGISTPDSRWTYNDADIHRLYKEEMQQLYQGHEIAMHFYTHPHLEELNDIQLAEQIDMDIANIKRWFPDNVLLGAAYPFGLSNMNVIPLLRERGIKWARTVDETHGFDVNDNLLAYRPSIRFRDEDMMDVAKRFIELRTDRKQVLFIWGHSYEFEGDHCWEALEALLAMLSHRDDIWYCTNSEALLD